MSRAFIDWRGGRRGDRGRYAVFKWRKPGGGYGTFTPEARITSAAEAKRTLATLNARLAAEHKPARKGADGSLTLEGIARLWEMAHAAQTYRPSVMKMMASFLEQTGFERPSDLTPLAMMKWKATASRSDRHNVRYVGAVLRWAARKLKVSVDPEAMNETSVPASKESKSRLLTKAELDAQIAKATAMGHGPLAHCLSVYGWRPITAARLKVADVDLAGATVSLRVKGQVAPFRHPLFAETVAKLRPLIEDRQPDEHVFLTSRGNPLMRDTDQTATRIIYWFYASIQPIAPEAGCIYAWKRWAITAMHRGLPPWPRPLSIPEIQLFTAHKTKSQVLRYLRASLDEARALVDHGSAASLTGSKPGSESLPETARETRGCASERRS